MTLIDEYLDEQDKYEKKYGEKTIILMEVGSFFEIYGINNETTNRGRIYEIADITALNISKKNDKYAPVSEKIGYEASSTIFFICEVNLLRLVELRAPQLNAEEPLSHT